MQTANGKAILFGEHFVVYDMSAVAISIAPGASATKEPADDFRLSIPQWSYDSLESPTSELTEAFCQLIDIIVDAGVSLRPVHITLECAVPSGAGLGSSGALGVATTRALLASCHILSTTEAETIHALTMAWESVFHGNPSGFDHAVSMRDGIVVYTPGTDDPFRVIAPAKDLHFIVAIAEPGASTSRMVEGVARFKDENPDLFEQMLQREARLIRSSINAIEQGNSQLIGRYMNENHQLLQQIGVSTEGLDDCVSFLREQGAQGAKLTGAGGGGAVVAIARSEGHRRQLITACQKHTIPTLSSTIYAP